VKNVAGSGRTVKPETGDQFVKVGSFGAPTADSFCFGTANCVSIDKPFNWQQRQLRIST